MLSRKFTQSFLSSNLTTSLVRNFGARFTQRTIIRPEQTPFIPYTRDQLKQMQENPHFEQELLASRANAKEQQVRELHFDHFSNDQNPANYLDLIVEDNTATFNPIEEEITSK